MLRAFGFVAATCCALAAVNPARAQGVNVGAEATTLDKPAYVFDTAEQHRLRVVVVARGLNHPFAVAVLPSGDALVSERGRALRIVRATTGLEPEPVQGLPAIDTPYRHAGLQDIILHPQFAQNHFVYFTFNRTGNPGNPNAKPPTRQQSRLTLFRAVFDGRALSKVQQLYSAPSGSTSGSRIAFDRTGKVYLTSGGPFGDDGQRLDTAYGKVLRLNDDGSIPKDNPFVARKDALPEIFSYGHRDHLGLTVNPLTGAILNAEHGPNGGDEVNLILPGHNYGWPLVSFGREYDGSRHSTTPVAEGVDQPQIVWSPSIGPSGITVYTGDRFPEWKGNIFVGSVRRGEVLRTGSLERVVVNDKLEDIRREALLSELHQRISDVRQGPDGLLYVLTDEIDGALLRLEPAT